MNRSFDVCVASQDSIFHLFRANNPPPWKLESEAPELTTVASRVFPLPFRVAVESLGLLVQTLKSLSRSPEKMRQFQTLILSQFRKRKTRSNFFFPWLIHFYFTQTLYANRWEKGFWRLTSVELDAREQTFLHLIKFRQRDRGKIRLPVWRVRRRPSR